MEPSLLLVFSSELQSQYLNGVASNVHCVARMGLAFCEVLLRRRRRQQAVRMNTITTPIWRYKGQSAVLFRQIDPKVSTLALGARRSPRGAL